MSGLQRKKVTVKTKRGKTYQRSMMVQTLKDQPHERVQHKIGLNLSKASDVQKKQAQEALAAIHMAHTHGLGPRTEIQMKVGGKQGWLGKLPHQHGHELIREYAFHVARNNPETSKRFDSVLRKSGNLRRIQAVVKKSQKLGRHKEEATDAVAGSVKDSRFQHGYAQWVGTKTKAGITASSSDPHLSGEANKHGVPVDFNHREMAHIGRFFDQEFGGKRHHA